MASKIMSDTNRDDTKASTANESIHENGDNLKNYGSAPGVVEDVVRVSITRLNGLSVVGLTCDYFLFLL